LNICEATTLPFEIEQALINGKTKIKPFEIEQALINGKTKYSHLK